MNRLLKPFYGISCRILERFPEDWREEREKDVQKQTGGLFPGKRICAKEYYARRLAVVLAMVFWGLGLAFFAELAAGQGQKERSQEYLIRPVSGEGDRETELEVLVEGETEKISLPVRISERICTPKEVQQIFGKIMDGLERQILGKNESLDRVRSDLKLPSSMYDGAVTIEWIRSPSDVIDERGAIIREVDDKGVLVELQALLRYREQEAEYTCYAHVYPPERTAKELLEKKLKEAVADADEVGKYEDKLVLPGVVDGKKVFWSHPATHTGLSLAVLVLAGAAAIWVGQSRKIKKLQVERRRQLLLDYPDLLFKMAMLLGAGMTLKGTFVKITDEYRKRRETAPRFVYEEMLAACRDMETGVGEAAAYESFGKRCGVACYVKLGSVLSQNLKKGAGGLQELLEREAAAGFEERKHAARKLGEEAGTKLLIPMIMMLGLVLVILVIPAVMSF
ncbi:MAG: type II secretion system F family protein [Lachnospiraceae bacterium]|nr:type II secretion system F family protein [Lachnospiraceae bacterium]